MISCLYIDSAINTIKKRRRAITDTAADFDEGRSGGARSHFKF